MLLLFLHFAQAVVLLRVFLFISSSALGMSSRVADELESSIGIIAQINSCKETTTNVTMKTRNFENPKLIFGYVNLSVPRFVVASFR